MTTTWVYEVVHKLFIMDIDMDILMDFRSIYIYMIDK